MARIPVNCGCEDAPCCGCDEVVLTGAVIAVIFVHSVTSGSHRGVKIAIPELRGMPVTTGYHPRGKERYLLPEGMVSFFSS